MNSWFDCDGFGRAPRATRRQLLAGAGLGALALWGKGSALAQTAFTVPDTGASLDSGRPTLVTIFLRGGADGLSILVPYGDGDYARNRPTLGIAPPRGHSRADQAASDRCLDLDGFFGLHPKLAPLLPLFREGQMAGVHAVGSGDDSHSHFEAMATVEAGRATQHPSPGSSSAGWLARHLACASGSNSPLRAVALGATLPDSLRGAAGALALESLADYALQTPAGWNDAKAQLGAMYGQSDDELARAGRDTLRVLQALERVQPAHYRARNGAAYPASSLGQGLQNVACLLRAKVGLEVACLDAGGWDTHIAQGSTTGWMALRLDDLAQSLAAFARDLNSEMSRVTVLVMTEFGRRASENSGAGTDHGRASMMLLLGGPSKEQAPLAGGQVHGRWPGLAPSALDGPGDLAVTTDYRDVLAEVVRGRLGNPNAHRVFPAYEPKAVGVIAA